VHSLPSKKKKKKKKKKKIKKKKKKKKKIKISINKYLYVSPHVKNIEYSRRDYRTGDYQR